MNENHIENIGQLEKTVSECVEYHKCSVEYPCWEKPNHYGEYATDRVRLIRRQVQSAILDWATALEMNNESASQVATNMREWLRKL